MAIENTIVIQVKRGTNVRVEEVDDLENDRALIALAPKDLKLAIKRGDPKSATGFSTVTMCG